jgi:hypothetical protein
MRVAPFLSLAAVVAVAGCADIGAINEARDDWREFGLAGERLVIDSDGADLRLVAGAGAAIEVRRSLTGKATLDGNASWSMDGGTLRLRAEYDVDVTGARTADVTATSTDMSVDLAFASPPTRVEARADGSVVVTLPGGPETYRVTTAPGRPALTSDPASRRTVTAIAGDDHTAHVRKAN